MGQELFSTELQLQPPVHGTRFAFMRDSARQVQGRSWANPTWVTPFPTRTFQIQEVPEHTVQPEVTRKLRDGSDYYPATYDVPRPVAVRPANLGSFFVSDPAPFQSYFRVHWEDLAGVSANLAEGTRKLSPLANPNARGRAEGQPLQAYNPWPSASQLGGVYPTAELKAI